MQKVLVKEIFRDYSQYLDQDILVSGWIRTSRDSKAFGFIELNDGTFFKNIQIVFDQEIPDFEAIKKYSLGASILVEGKLIASSGAKQAFEIKAAKIELVGACAEDYPIQKKKSTLEYLRTIPHLRPRTNTFSAVFRVRSLAAFAIHKFFTEKGFVYVQTPIITGSDAEGAGEMFRVSTFDLQNLPFGEDGKIDYAQDFFGKETNLTVSGQLHVENFCMAFRNVYTFGPTFRAENSFTARHAAEFWMIEPEIAFADLNDDRLLAEEFLKYVIRYVLENAPEEMEFFNKFIDVGISERLNNLLSSDFGHVTYTEAVELLKKSGRKFEYPVEWGIDLQSEHERYLAEVVFKKPVAVTDYPKDIKAFYMRLNDDGKTVAAMDILAPGVGEIVGGSQREERYDVLVNRIKEMGIAVDDWYLDLRRFGGTPHAGFGLGFDRLLMYITGMTNIRDVQPYPRTTRNCDF